MSQLAIDGGPQAKPTPYATGDRFDHREREELELALAQQTLFYYSGERVTEFERRLAELYGVDHAVACSSGTASIHAAVAAAGIGPGDEVIVPPFSDMGTVIGILYQGGVPVFADVDPLTMNLDAGAVEEVVGPHTKAILPVHYAGCPCALEPLQEIAARYELVVIEDCAQAWHAEAHGKLVGTTSELGCFSLNDYKHITVGDGGAVLTDDDALAARARLYTDKCYDRTGNNRTASALCPNYRMSELCGAVGLAQLEKVAAIVNARRRHGTALSAMLADAPGLTPQAICEGGAHSYYRYSIIANPEAFDAPLSQVVKAINAEGVPLGIGGLSPGGAPLYLTPVFQTQEFFPGYQGLPGLAAVGRDLPQRWAEGLCPVAEAAFATTLVFYLRQWFSERDVEQTGAALVKVALAYGA